MPWAQQPRSGAIKGRRTLIPWPGQIRCCDHAPTRYPDALADELPAEVSGPEDGEAALQAATELLNWAAEQLG